MNGLTDFVEILTGRAESKPDDVAYIFVDNKGNEKKIRYGELHEKVKSLAAKMQIKHKKNTRAFLFFRPGLDFIIAYYACLYANIIAVPVAHSKNIRGIEKISKIFENADCDIFLTTSEDSPSKPIIEKYPALAEAEYILTDTFLISDEFEWNKPSINQDDVAFLQYTSGSTAEPKGVMVTHGNLIHNQKMMQDALGFNEKTVFAGWLPHFHDLGLIADILLPMFLGIPSILMAPMTFLQSPMSWLKIITKYKVTSSGAPNFAFDFCVDKISKELFCELDLSSWSVAFCGAEPISANSLRRFANKFSSCGFNENAFRPCYGMAEATVFLTGANTTNNNLSVNVSKSALSKNKVNLIESSKDALEIVSCGEVNGGQQLVIVDPVLNKEVKDSEVGEIWARGDSITKGYWRNSKETKNVFNAFMHDSSGPYYKTGDLGFKQKEQVYVTGRLKDLIIIKGHNHYPNDIEQVAESSSPMFRSGGSCAFSISEDMKENLVIVSEVAKSWMNSFDYESMLKVVSKNVYEYHGLKVSELILIPPLNLPKTTSGKKKRKQTKALFIENSLPIITGCR